MMVSFKKKYFVPLVLFSGALVSVGLSQQSGAQDLTIGIIGDQTGTSDLDTAYQVLQQGVDALNQSGESFDVFLHVGDMVESTQSMAQIRARFGQATSILNQLPKPWYTVAGDHDVNPPGFAQNSTDRSRETLYKQLYGAINPAAADTLYYSFDEGSYHFVALYSLEHLHTDPRWGNAFYSGLTDTQFEWLQNDLAANSVGKTGTIVFLHQPMWYMWTNWKRVHDLLAQHNVIAVIAGHYHYNQIEGVLDGIDYRIVGATGGTTKSGQSNSGDLQHVSILKVSGTNLDFTMVPLSPFTQTRWTERPPMDLIQALDQNLGSIFNFPSDSPLYLNNGVLVSDCTTNAPAQLVVKGIGNAAANPVSVAVNVVRSNSAMTLSSETFGAGLCEGGSSGYTCLLKDSAGIAVSNTSIVQASEYPPPPPLWSATVGGTGLSIGDSATISIAQSFQYMNDTYLVEKSNVTTVAACP